MQDRDPSSRRVVGGSVEPVSGRDTRPPGGRDFWQVLAIVALIVATAGWTTVAVLATREPAAVVGNAPEATFDPNTGQDGSPEPIELTHDAPALEALLPAELDGTPLEIQSWTGDALLADDPWSTSITTFLSGYGKIPADLEVAQGHDATQVLEGSIGVYRATGIPGTAMRDALLAAWKGDFTDMTVEQLTLSGVEITKGGFGPDTAASYLYVRGELVYDIETTDDVVASAALASLVEGGAAGPSPS